jgi:hypothetical protein
MKISHWCTAGALALALFGASGTVAADTLLIERLQQESTASRPARGILMSQVLARFGEPTSRIDPVGGGSPQHPPIARWVYPEYTVYFENDHVIDSVANTITARGSAPQPAN